MTAHFEIYDRADGDAGWRLQAANGEIIATGEGFTRATDAERAVHTLIDAILQIADQSVDDSIIRV